MSDLSGSTENTESALLEVSPQLGLYVNIPFCLQKCPYCDFVSGPFEKAARRSYLAVLEREIRNSPFSSRSVSTVYFGGGTPSEASTNDLETLVRAVHETFATAAASEWSIECNPEGLTREALRGMLSLGFDRISLGVQSFQDDCLRILGRAHSGADSTEAYRLARDAGFENINLDLLFALPGQSSRDWKLDLLQGLSLSPEHLSLYRLTVEEGTEFGKRQSRGELREVDEERVAEMYELSLDLAAGSGFCQYELSSFAKPGCECLHNLGYWSYAPYLGFGMGSTSFAEGIRWTNTSVLGDYLRLTPGAVADRSDREHLRGRKALGEEFMLRLHTEAGVPLSEMTDRYGLDVRKFYADSFELLTRQGLIRLEVDRARLTRKGKLVAADVCGEFLIS